MRVALVNAPLRSYVSDLGVGHQMPLGHLMVGGPLLADGHSVCLVDGARLHLTHKEIVERVLDYRPRVACVGHTGATAAHTACLETLRAIKAADASITTIYGGIHATYHDIEILGSEPAVDVIVRGEGEETMRELALALASERPEALTTVRGIARRERGGRPIRNPLRPPCEDLDALPVGWDLVENWDLYQAFGLGRSAVVQWSRGCPHKCTFCGQWAFWRKWRHRDAARFARELAWLHRERDVRHFWLADENPTTDRGLWRSLLREIAARRLNATISCTLRAADVVRDADLAPLMRRAGVSRVLLGVEAVTDEALERIRKRSRTDDATRAIRILRRHGILCTIDVIFGLEDESFSSLWRTLQGLLSDDGDFLNALYVTPYAWTALAHELRHVVVHESDIDRWDYRHPVLGTRRLSPASLFLAVKTIELVYHLRPSRLLRAFLSRDPEVRRYYRYCDTHAGAVFLQELSEFLFDHLSGRSMQNGRLSLENFHKLPGSCRT